MEFDATALRRRILLFDDRIPAQSLPASSCTVRHPLPRAGCNALHLPILGCPNVSSLQFFPSRLCARPLRTTQALCPKARRANPMRASDVAIGQGSRWTQILAASPDGDSVFRHDSTVPAGTLLQLDRPVTPRYTTARDSERDRFVRPSGVDPTHVLLQSDRIRPPWKGTFAAPAQWRLRNQQPGRGNGKSVAGSPPGSDRAEAAVCLTYSPHKRPHRSWDDGLHTQQVKNIPAVETERGKSKSK